MEKGKKSFFIGIVILMFSLIIGCNGGGDDGDKKDDDRYGDNSIRLTFDLTNAKAVASSDSTNKKRSDMENAFDIDVYKSDAEDAFGLVKIMEDGSIEPAMEITGTSLPDISFIAKSPVSDDLYISFSHNIYSYSYKNEIPTGSTEYNDDGSYDDGEDGDDGDSGDYDYQETNLGSLIHVKPDGSYVAVMEGKDGNIPDQSWFGGAEDWKPVVFDGNGNLYFCYQEWGTSGMNLQAIYKYDPSTGEANYLTPPLDGYSYRAFEIDPTGTRLFVQGERWSNTSSTSFFRMYPLANLNRYVNIYFSSNSDIWVRGFKISPDGSCVILNGWNIRGINGILKVNIISDSELSYESLYSQNEGSGDWFDPIYNEWYADWENKTYYNGLFDNFSTDYETYMLVTDGSSHYYARAQDLANGYVYVTNGSTLYLAGQSALENPEDYGSSYVLMTDGTQHYMAYEYSLEYEDNYYTLMTDGSKFYYTYTWDLENSYDGTNYLLSYNDGENWYYDGVIGSNIYFAENDEDPAQTSSATSISELSTIKYVRSISLYNTSGSYVNYKYLGINVWYATNSSDYTLKSLDTDYSTFAVSGSVQKVHTIDYYSTATQNHMGNGILGQSLFIATSSTDATSYDSDATALSEVDEGTPQTLAQLSYFELDENGWEDWSNSHYGTAGSDFYFASSDTDATQYFSETSIANLTAAGNTPIMKRVKRTWDESGENINIVDVPSEVVDAVIAEPGVSSWYTWNEHWYVDEDISTEELDMDAIMSYIGSYYITDIEFKWNDATGETAFTNMLDDQPFSSEEIYGENIGGHYGGGDSWFFLKNHVQAAGTDTPAQTFQEFREANDLGWLNFSDVGNMFFDDTGSLWGVLGGSGWWGGSQTDPKPIKLLDSDGNRDLKVINAFTNDTYMPVGFTIKGNYLYFRNAIVDGDGWETGFHNLMRFDITQEVPVVEDLLTNVPDNGWIEIVDFSVGHGFLYFTGVSGIEVVGGKVNLSTNEYTPFSTEARLSNLEVY